MAGMMTSLLLLLLAGVTVGRVVDLQKRIIGGHTCDATERLYHVALIRDDESLQCGGSLISNQWILTAAHCLTPGVTLRAVLGLHPFGQIGSVRHNIIDIQRVPDVRWLHDIALLKLSQPVMGVDPVGLPDCSKPPPQIDEEVQIAGYGPTQPNGPRGNFIEPETLQCADTKVGHCNQCSPPPDPDYYFTLDNLICCQTTGVDTSPGDSGGGLVFKNKIYGVISFLGLQPCVAPVVATSVCYYLPWIKLVTRIV